MLLKSIEMPGTRSSGLQGFLRDKKKADRCRKRAECPRHSSRTLVMCNKQIRMLKWAEQAQRERKSD
jgi:hypothetical protein